MPIIKKTNEKDTDRHISTETVQPEHNAPPSIQIQDSQSETRRDFKCWFDDTIKERASSTSVEIPWDIVSIPCGCTRSPEEGTKWTLKPESLESFAYFRTSRLIMHTDCGKPVGEFATPWATL